MKDQLLPLIQLLCLKMHLRTVVVLVTNKRKKRREMMRVYFKFFLLVVCMFILSACGSSAVVNKSLNESLKVNNSKYTVSGITSNVNEVPDHFLAAVNGYLKAELEKKNLLDKNASKKSYKINILVDEYRMRSGMTRMMFGAFAGKDGVESIVTILDPVTGEVEGKSTVSTFNITAVGGMDDIARMHAEKIVEFISGEIKG